MQSGPQVTRQQFAFLLLCGCWLLMAGRIAMIQIIDHHNLHLRATNQREQEVTVRGNRGRILDRTGQELAVNLESASYGFRSAKVKNLSATADALSRATGLSSSSVRAMAASDKSFQWLIRQADQPVIEKLDALKLPCIEKFPEPRRYYPLGTIGAQLIGYTDIDGKGIEGCEFLLDNTLMGRNGRSVLLKDAKQRVVPSLDKPLIEPEDGSDVVLTIDSRIQEIAEEELEAGITKFKAESGGAIIMDTSTGEILAMANAPRFNPNTVSDGGGPDAKFRKNRMATDMLEPGSTFKIVTFTEALESGVVDEDDMIFCENGQYRIGSHIVNDSHELGTVSVREVLAESSNIGTVKIAEKIGKKNLYERARLYGFGEVTGFDLPGETAGMLDNPKNWSNMSLPTISFGQGVAVSPLQMIMAYGAIANGGMLISPHIISEIRKSDGHIEKTGKKTIRRVMKVETAARMRELLCNVVEEGTGATAAIPDMRIAGKTGTAQRPLEGGKGYAPGRYISSFIGFVADRDPKILCFVMIDTPKGVIYGSQVAAPVFKNIMNRMFNMGDNLWIDKELAETKNKGTDTKSLPSMKGFTVEKALKTLHDKGFAVTVVGDSTTVVRQFPIAGAELLPGAAVTIYSNTETKVSDNTVKVPDLKGKSLREAVQQLVQVNLKVTVNGTGAVKEQTPRPGSVVELGTVCAIVCGK